MKLVNYKTTILFLLTLLYSALVILNPANYFGDGKGESLLAVDYIKNSYPSKALAIQLVGTTIIACGIIISRERPAARILILTGTWFVWTGLTISIDNNPILLGTTLLLFPGSILLMVIGIGLYMLLNTTIKLTFHVTAWSVRRVNSIRHRGTNLILSTKNRITERIAQIWHTINKL